MDREIKSPDKIVLARLVRLNANVQGVVTGLLMGLGLFIATNWLVLKGGPVVGPHLKLLGQYFLGYTVTFEGSLIGLAYGLGLGFCLGYLVARIYNWLVDIKDRRRRSHA